jgi:polyisoprenoid-binding protein YceI
MHSAMKATRFAAAIVVTTASALGAQPSQSAPTVFRVLPGSTASYAVDEVFLNENNRLFTAVGASTAVSGSITVDRSRLSASRVDEIVVDLRELQSDSERRDRALRAKYLDTHQYPWARLTRGTVSSPTTAITPSRPFTFTIVGDLTIHGTTRRTTWRGEATIVGDTLRGVARTDVKMSHFGMEVPRLLSLRSADDVKLELRIVAAPQPMEP